MTGWIILSMTFLLLRAVSRNQSENPKNDSYTCIFCVCLCCLHGENTPVRVSACLASCEPLASEHAQFGVRSPYVWGLYVLRKWRSVQRVQRSGAFYVRIQICIHCNNPAFGCRCAFLTSKTSSFLTTAMISRQGYFSRQTAHLTTHTTPSSTFKSPRK